MTVAGDSVLIYHWGKKNNTSYSKVAIDEIAVKAALAKQKANADTERTVLLKLSDAEFLGGGFMGNVYNLKQWAIESGFTNVKLADAEPGELASFHLRPVPWARFDSVMSYRPHLDLHMPKDDPDEQQIKDAALTLILLEDSVIYYHKKNINDAARLSYTGNNSIRGILKKEPKNGVIAIKSAPGISYSNLVDILDQMTINHFSKYSVVDLSQNETTMFGIESMFENMPVQSPSSRISQEIPEDNAFLIEIKTDQSVWYQPRSQTSRMISQKVDSPVTNNLQQIIGDYAKAAAGNKITYLIKADKTVSYTIFKQVLNALKAYNIYKYNLITSE